MYVGVGGDRHREEKFACCQPEAVHRLNVTDANRVPLLLYRPPTCVPVFAADL